MAYIGNSTSAVNSSLSLQTDKATGRGYIYAAPFDALAYNGMQVNGSMEVSQELGTTLTAVSNGALPYAMDGWGVYSSGTVRTSFQQVADAPPGFTNSLKLTITTAQSSLGVGDAVGILQKIEGYRTSRLSFGTASAKPISFGFWVKVHRPGTYSGSVQNTGTRSCPFSFTVSAADTWEFKTVTVLGDTTGTWVGNTNGVGLQVWITMAAGSSLVGTAGSFASSNLIGATGTTNGVAATSDTFQVTGFVILPGLEFPTSDRLPYIMRPYEQEIRICRRYWQGSSSTVGAFWAGNSVSGSTYYLYAPLSTIMRVAPTIAEIHGNESGFPTTGTVGGAFLDGFYYSRVANATVNGAFYHFGWSADARF